MRLSFSFELQFSNYKFIMESLVHWHCAGRSNSLLACCASVQCLIWDFADIAIFLQTHCILSTQCLIGLTQLNFDGGLLIIETFDFVFYLIISKHRLLLRWVIHVDLHSFSCSVLLLCQDLRPLPFSHKFVGSSGCQIIWWFLHLVALCNNCFWFFTILRVSCLSSSKLVPILYAHLRISSWSLRHMNLVPIIFNHTLKLLDRRGPNV